VAILIELIKCLLSRKRGNVPYIDYFGNNEYLNFECYYSKFKYIFLFFIIILFSISMVIQSIFLRCLLWLFIIILFYKFKIIKKKLLLFVEQNFLIDKQLLKFIFVNKLFDVANEESVVFSYIKKGNYLMIIGLKQGNLYDRKIENLDTELQGLLKIPLFEKEVEHDSVKYYFRLKPCERLIVSSSGHKEWIKDFRINLGYGVIYNPVECPHIAISGGTGSGKTMFISYLLLEFVKRSGINNIYICDPKNSDLGSLSHYLGDVHVAKSSNSIARVMRLAVETMKSRYTEMENNFKYGTNFVEHGYKPIWIIFDEMGAFQASGIDKQSKNVVNEVMDSIKQIILLGRQAGVFILISAQQMRAETLNTDLRDNLGLRIALGSNSSEGYRMMFGSAMPENKPVIKEKGAGLLFMQGSGQKAKYWESPFIDINSFNFVDELKLYVD